MLKGKRASAIIGASMTTSAGSTIETTASAAAAAVESRHLQRIFEALSSAPRRKILAYLSAGSLTAGEIAERFEMSKPSVSQHLGVLETSGLISKEKKGQFVHYTLVRDSLVNTLNGFVQDVCPAARPLKQEAKSRAKKKPSE